LPLFKNKKNVSHVKGKKDTNILENINICGWGLFVFCLINCLVQSKIEIRKDVMGKVVVKFCEVLFIFSKLLT